MTTLLSFRDNIKAFCCRYDYIITPVLKFILSIIILESLHKQLGYLPILGNIMLILVISGVCAFLPVEMLTIVGGIFIIAQATKVSVDVGILMLALVLIFYCGYMRFFTKTGIIVLLVPLAYSGHLAYALPIVLGFLVGPKAIIPAIFGVILYYVEDGLGELLNVLAASADKDEAVAGYQYILNGLIDNKQMLLTLVVFTCVILITYIIYRASFKYSWIVAFVVGGIMNVVLFLVGSLTKVTDMEISPILLGSLAGILFALIIQFGKGVVDYQRTELLQFEDDDYYYYVKAIPKLAVAESNKNIKHINSKTHN